MHGTELRNQDDRAVFLSLTAAAFQRQRIRRSRDRLSHRSCSEPASRNGLSLAYNDCPSPDHHCKVKVPGLPLRCPTGLFSNPLTSRSTTIHDLHSQVARFHARDPLLGSRPASPVSFRISTSLQGLSTLPDQSVQLGSLPENSPSECTRSPFAPRGQSIVIGATDQRSRSAKLPEACCSSNLLEPLSIMHRHSVPVK
jgi:hypothetical protein